MAKARTIPLPRMPKLPSPPAGQTGLSVWPRLPKLPHPPQFGKGPRSIGPAISAIPSEWPAAPPDFQGTRPEWLVYWALTKLGLTPQIDFTFQSSQMGPRWQAGSSVVDFLIVNRVRPLCLRAQGMWWHYEAGSPKQAKDILQRQELEESGIEVVDVDEDDILRDPLFYTQRALDGVDLSTAKYREVG